MMRETGKTGYKNHVIKRLRRTFPEVVVLINDPTLFPGIPDLTLLFRYCFWAVLEVKVSESSPKRPNQEHYVDILNEMSFGAIIHQDNEEEVFLALQSAYESCRQARVS